MLEAKELKKKAEAEEKEERKLERERKRKEAAELKEKRAREREEKKKQREEAAAKKKEESIRKKAEAARKKEEAAKRKRTRSAISETYEHAGMKAGCSATVDSTGEPRPKRAKIVESEPINTNQCAMCFLQYEDDETGDDWVECVCGRWLHDECIEECVIDSKGKERICPVCLTI